MSSNASAFATVRHSPVARVTVCASSALLLLLSGCHASRRDADGAAALPIASSSAGVAEGVVSSAKASRDITLPGYVVVRRYQDVYKYAGADVPVTVEYGWDYRRGIAVERVYDRDGGAARETRDRPGLTLNLTDAELELAFALAREHPELAIALSQPDLNFYGGFSYESPDDPVCTTGSRCVHVIVSAGDGNTAVAHAIVDLMTRKVVDPHYERHDVPAPSH
jgi:hypothetical protein